MNTEEIDDDDDYTPIHNAQIEAALDVLREHFESVIILAESRNENGSRWWRDHFGSTFACTELCRMFTQHMDGQYHKRGSMTFEEGCEEED